MKLPPAAGRYIVLVSQIIGINSSRGTAILRTEPTRLTLPPLFPVFAPLMYVYRTNYYTCWKEHAEFVYQHHKEQHWLTASTHKTDCSLFTCKNSNVLVHLSFPFPRKTRPPAWMMAGAGIDLGVNDMPRVPCEHSFPVSTWTLWLSLKLSSCLRPLHLLYTDSCTSTDPAQVKELFVTVTGIVS